jgi:hypothetical protein
MLEKHDRCDRCGDFCNAKDNQILGPLEGKYEWLCHHCAIREEMTPWPLKWRDGKDSR